MRNLADLIVDFLVANNCKVVFGFPGETSLPLYMAMQRRKNDIRHVLARSPRGAGYMADAYTRLSGHVGIADSPGGIGSPFAVPCAHEANNSSIPMLFLASADSNTSSEKWSTSQCDQQTMFGAVTKQTFQILTSEAIEERLGDVLKAVKTPPFGPVFLEVPVNILNTPWESVKPVEGLSGFAYISHGSESLSSEQHRRIESLLADKSSIAILAGGGSHHAACGDALRCVVDKSGIPVATTLNGKGIISEVHPRCLGVAGGKGLDSANNFLEKMDCIIAIGTKAGDKSTNFGQILHHRQMVIHVDNNARNLAPEAANYIPICADAGSFFKAMLKVSLPEMHSLAIPKQEAFWPDSPTAQLCRFISDMLPENAVVSADASVARGWAGAAVRFNKAGQRLITPAGSGSLSFALPAAIGAAIARPGSAIVGIGGDGGFSMALHDMETAVRLDVPIAYFLLNNNRLGLIDKHATALMDGDPVSAGFVELDWKLIASGFRWDYIEANDIDQISARLPDLSAVPRPLLINYRVPIDEMGPDFYLTLMRKQKRGKGS